MKKLFAIALLLLLPFSSYAAINVGWSATSTDKGVIIPNKVNGNNPGLWISGNSLHVGDTANTFGVGTCDTSEAKTCLELIGNDNTQAGVSLAIQNINSGNNGYSDVVWFNDNPNGLTNFTACAMQSSTYNYTGFGTAYSFPNQFGCNNTFGQFTIGANSFVNIITGGVNSTNENTRFTTISGNPAVGIGSTSPSATLSVNAGAQNYPYFAIGSSTGQVEEHWPNGVALVGIGTSSPNVNVMLDVAGSVYITSSAANALIVGSTGSANPGFQVDQSGGVGTGVAIQTNTATNGVIIQGLSSGANEALTVTAKGTGTTNIGNGSGASAVSLNPGTGGVSYVLAGSNVYTFNRSQISMTNNLALATAATVRFAWTGAADTNLTTLTEAPDVYFNMGQTRTHANGAIATQRDFRISPSTHASNAGVSVANGTIASSSSLSIDGPPGQGNFMNYTNTQALFIGPGGTYTSASTSNAFGLVIQAPTGAAINGAASTTGSIVHNNLDAFAVGDSAICQRSSGFITVDAGVSSCIVSSKFVKDPQGDVAYEDAYNRIMKLQGVMFRYKENKKEDIGLYAEDVAKIDKRYAQYAESPYTDSYTGHQFNAGDPKAINWSAIQTDMLVVLQHQSFGYKAMRSVEENWQWGFMGLLFLWNLVLTFRRKRV